MPRKPDARLEGRILDAAYRLWSTGAESALTMRAVAQAARTSTPTVYQRFRDKRDILEMLRRRAQQKLFSAVNQTRSLPEFCERYFDFALGHKNEYELIHADWAVRLAREEPRPSLDLLKGRLAERLGGAPDHHARLALALAALAHGTASVLLAEGVHSRINRHLREICAEAWESLVENASDGRHFLRASATRAGLG